MTHADCPDDVRRRAQTIKVADQCIPWYPSHWLTIPGLSPAARWAVELLAEQCGISTRDLVGDGPRLEVTRGQVLNDFNVGSQPMVALVAALVWGCGTRYRMVRRIGRALVDPSERNDLTAKAGRLIEHCQGATAGDAWISFRRDNAIPHLGAAFGSKVAYFAAYGATTGRASAVDLAPLIADRNITLGLHRAGHERLQPTQRQKDYSEYVEIATAWALTLEPGFRRADQIEYGLFCLGKNHRIS